MPKQKSKEREKKERSMARIKFKRIAAIAMSAVLAVTSAPNLSLDFSAIASADELSDFGTKTKATVSCDGYLSDNSGAEALTGDFEVEYTFTNKSADTSLKWNNYVVVVADAANVENRIVTRPDWWGCCNGTWSCETRDEKDKTISVPERSNLGDTIIHWDSYAATMADASVTINIKREGQTITVSNKFVGNSNSVVNGYVAKYKMEKDCLPDTLSMYLSGEKCTLSDIKVVDKTNRDSGSDTDTETKAFGSNTIDKFSIDEGFLSNTGNETISGNFDVQYTFTNKTKSTAENWYSFIIEIFDSKGGITDRADRWGWFYGAHGEGTDKDGSSHTWEGIVSDWEDFKETMKDANVVVDVSRRDKVVTISYTITDNADNAKVYKLKDTVTFGTLEDSVSMHITGAYVDLSNIKLVDKTDSGANDDSDTDTETKAFGENTASDLSIVAFCSANTGNETISGDFDIQYTFTNKTTGSKNWDNFIIEIFDSKGGVRDRADNWGWLTGDYAADGSEHTWDDINFDWPTFNASMKNANVVVDVSRRGEVVTISYTITDNTDTSKVYKLKDTVKFATLEDTVTMHLTGENVDLSNIKLVDKTDRDDDTPTTPQEISASDVTAKYDEYFSESNQKKHVTVHDPSVVIGYTDGKYTGDRSQRVYGKDNGSRQKVYFIFGSHRAFAWSTDMQNWTTFTNNINDDTKCQALFKSAFDWATKGDSSYGWSGNLWAPDVIWNEQMNKWCMYMSINGKSWNSSIVLLTSDSLNGDWENQGTVVYSGFTKSGVHAYTDTDFASVVGSDNADAALVRFKSSDTTWNSRYGAHAIDPCVTYDSDGNLWMSYGSWSGGIWIFKLDPKTGLRDTATKYDYKENETDPYMGYKLAGGVSRSGEASYIEKIGDKYYLFLSYGGLTAKGGYNMRVFSSDAITGPYKDVAGNDARYGTETSVINKNAGGDGYGNTATGERLMSYYNWHYLDKGRVAQGHNSAVVDTDGKTYLVYHTRFNDGSDGHEVRVHQLFTAGNGGLVATPFEYSGETLSNTAYAVKEVAGEYTVIYHEPSVNTTALQCCEEKSVKLNKDGSVSGDYTGKWEQESDKPYVTLTIDNVKYQGVFIKQKVEGTNCETMCFTLVGSNNITIWGTKGYTNEQKVIKDAGDLSLTVPEQLNTDLELPVSGNEGSTIKWESSDETALSNTGEIQAVAKDTTVTLTATIKNGLYYTKKEYTTTIKANATSDIDSGLEANYTFENGLRNEVNTEQVGEAKTLESGTKPTVEYSSDRAGNVLNQYFGYEAAATTSYAEFTNPLKGKTLNGATVSMWVNRQNDDAWDALWSFFDTDNSDGADGRLFFTPNTYLGYNGTVGGTWQWFDCNKAEKPVNNIPVNSWHYVTVSVGKANFGIYVDGKLVVNKTKYTLFDSNDSYASLASNMLKMIASADKFYLGYGSFWGSSPAYMDNVKIYSRALSAADIGTLYKAEKADTAAAKNAEEQKEQALADASILYKSFNNDADAAAAGGLSANAADNLTLASDGAAEHTTYLQFAPGNINSRSAYLDFGSLTVPDNYVVEFDSKLTAGNNQETQLALAVSEYSKKNDILASDSYLWSLNALKTTEWTISGGSTAKTTDTASVDIATDTWVHVKTVINKTKNTMVLTITDEAGKELVSKKFEMDSIADIKGLFVLSGRYNGVTALDNVRVYVPTGKYTVKLDPNYTTDTMTATSQEYAVGETGKLPKNTFTRENYDFLGWSTTPGGAVEYKDEQEIKDLAQDAGVAILYAVWKEYSYTIIYNPSGTDGEEMTQIVKLGQKFNLYENPYTRAVYTFEGWLDKTNGDKIYSNGQTISTDLAAKGETITLYAVWKSSSSSSSSGGSSTTPTATPTVKPTATAAPTTEPTTAPSSEPVKPTAEPTVAPTAEPTTAPTTEPTVEPTTKPTTAPTVKPTTKPTLKNASITVKKGKKKVSTVTVKKKKTVTITVSANSGAKVYFNKLSKANAKKVKVTLKNKKLTIKGLKKGTVKVKLLAKKTSKYKAASKTIKIKVK